MSRAKTKTTKKRQTKALKPASKKTGLLTCIHNLQSRRPHRSFRLTRRADAKRRLTLPSYLALTHEVNQTLWRYKRTLLLLVLVYAAAILLVGGIISQDSYIETQSLLKQTSGEIFTGQWGAIGESSTLLISAMTESLNVSNLDINQQLYLAIFATLVWLTTIWLLRAQAAGGSPKLRDALYGAGAPLVPSALLSILLMVQCIPLGIVAVAYGALATKGFLDEGVGPLLFDLLAAAVVSLVLYWAIVTFLALVIVTIPGMYPMRAIRTAGDIVAGRRLVIILRIVWMIGYLSLLWVITAVPSIMFDAWLKDVWPASSWLALVPMILSVLASGSVVWAATYIYLFYRKVIDYDAAH